MVLIVRGETLSCFLSSLTSSASLTASAVCLFNLDEQFYDVFTAPSKQINRRTSMMNNEMTELIRNCSQTIPSTIDRDFVESDKQFSPFLSNPLLIETMATYTFTSINVIQHDLDHFCLIIGTSKTAGKIDQKNSSSRFRWWSSINCIYRSDDENQCFRRIKIASTDAFIDPIDYLSKNVRSKMVCALPNRRFFRFSETNSYIVIVTNHLGYLPLKLIPCKDKLCLVCWTIDCSIERVASEKWVSICTMSNICFYSVLWLDINVLPMTVLDQCQWMTPTKKRWTIIQLKSIEHLPIELQVLNTLRKYHPMEISSFLRWTIE